MWRQRGFIIAINLGNRAGPFANRTFSVLSFAHNRRANFPQFPMGHFAAGNRLFVDLFRAVATFAEGTLVVAGIGDPGYSLSGVAASAVFAQTSSLQTDAH